MSTKKYQTIGYKTMLKYIFIALILILEKNLKSMTRLF